MYLRFLLMLWLNWFNHQHGKRAFPWLSLTFYLRLLYNPKLLTMVSRVCLFLLNNGRIKTNCTRNVHLCCHFSSTKIPQLRSSMASSAAAQSFILRLHGLGDSGSANEPIKSLFASQILVVLFLLLLLSIEIVSSNYKSTKNTPAHRILKCDLWVFSINMEFMWE